VDGQVVNTNHVSVDPERAPKPPFDFNSNADQHNER